MRLLLVCLLFGAALALTEADPTEDKPKNEGVDPEVLEDPEDPEDPDKDGRDVSEPESVEETEAAEDEDPEDPEDLEEDAAAQDVAEPESVDEAELAEDDNELSEAEDEDDGKPSDWFWFKRRCRAYRWCKKYGRRYMYFRFRRTWAQAQRICLSRGGTLASVRNSRVHRFLKKLVRRKKAWIGFSDAQQERYWFWINGKRRGYTKWCRGQPDNHRGHQHCALINWSRKKCWDDQSCSTRHRFVCERK